MLRKILLYSALASLLLNLPGCGNYSIQVDEKSAFSPVRDNPWIVVLHPLHVYPGHARAYLQGGRVIHPDTLDLYEVNCELEIDVVRETEQDVPAGSYMIRHIQVRMSPNVWLPQQKQLLAMGGGRGSSIDIKRYYQFTLSSHEHPQVLNMFCRGAQDNEFSAELPTLEQMQRAVGKYIQFHLLAEQL